MNRSFLCMIGIHDYETVKGTRRQVKDLIIETIKKYSHENVIDVSYVLFIDYVFEHDKLFYKRYIRMGNFTESRVCLNCGHCEADIEHLKEQITEHIENALRKKDEQKIRQMQAQDIYNEKCRKV